MSLDGHIYRNTEGRVALVDGIIASLFYAFDRYADKVIFDDTLLRNFSVSDLKISRLLLYEAFKLKEVGGKVPNTMKPETLLKDLWVQITKIDMKNYENVNVCFPYNFVIPKFVCNGVHTAEIAQETVTTLLGERMNSMEKKLKEKDDNVNMIMTMLKAFTSKFDAQPVVAPPSSVGAASLAPHSFASVAAPRGLQGSQGRHQQHLRINSGHRFDRDRSPSLKRPTLDSNDNEERKKQKSTSTQPAVIVGTGDKEMKLKSPPADIFVYGLTRDTTPAMIADHLADTNILVKPEDIKLMSKGDTSLLSFKVSVKAVDLPTALLPATWPFRVKVREFIHYKNSYRKSFQNKDKVRSETKNQQDGWSHVPARHTNSASNTENPEEFRIELSNKFEVNNDEMNT